MWEPGAPGEHSRAGKGPGRQEGAPPGEEWAVGALPALKGRCWGSLGKVRAWRGLWEDARD